MTIHAETVDRLERAERSHTDSLNARITALEDEVKRARRAELMAMAVFETIMGDRTGLGALTYVCPTCKGVDSGDPSKPGTLCERCQGRGVISLRHKGSIAMWEAQKEANESRETP